VIEIVIDMETLIAGVVVAVVVGEADIIIEISKEPRLMLNQWTKMILMRYRQS
jgi:hypothetical protein